MSLYYASLNSAENALGQPGCCGAIVCEETKVAGKRHDFVDDHVATDVLETGEILAGQYEAEFG